MMAATSIGAVLADASAAVSADQYQGLIVCLIILVFGVVLGIGIVCCWLALHSVRRNRSLDRGGLFEAPARDRRSAAALLGLPNRWLAIRSGNPYVVQAALGLHKPTPCSWEEGLTAATDQKLFISPPVNGWVLVFGASLPDPADDVDRCFRFLLEVTRKLGQVQLFSFNRIVNHHAWVQGDQGRIVRAYAWAGKTLWNQGAMTRAEIELGLTCFDYAEGPPRFGFGQPDPLSVNTERVPLLASRWSLDPGAIDARTLRQSHGITGRLSRSRAR
ncbi:MAG: hypothetical protein L0Y58_07080 [Verrucomicrobia subdivision 3 bacterium]|nr:hypothetical protein [Limisphaerales bacterium]